MDMANHRRNFVMTETLNFETRSQLFVAVSSSSNRANDEEMDVLTVCEAEQEPTGPADHDRREKCARDELHFSEVARKRLAGPAVLEA